MLQEIDRVENIIGLADHNKRVGELALELSRFINLSNEESKKIYMAAKQHDIGKCYLSADILNKPGELTKEEFEVIKTHTAYSYKHLKSQGKDEEICLMAKYHHENFDGSGYPEGLKDKKIPFGARIIRVCDVFDALTNTRIYRKSLDYTVALEIMIRESNYYDPFILNTFIYYITKNIISAKL